jgi:hypothetical protein
MTDKLEFIIDRKSQSVVVRKTDAEDSNSVMVTPIRLGVPYTVKWDSKHPNLLNILPETGKNHDEVFMNGLKRTFDNTINKAYSDLTMRISYSRKEHNDVAEIFVPERKYTIIIQ